MLLAWLVAALYEAVLAALAARSAPLSSAGQPESFGAVGPPLLQFALRGLFSVPVGVLASAVHLVTYAEPRGAVTARELAEEIIEEIAEARVVRSVRNLEKVGHRERTAFRPTGVRSRLRLSRPHVSRDRPAP